MDKLETYWKTFLTEKNLPSSTRYQEAFHFELTEYWADELLRLVLVGQKRATASSRDSFTIEGQKVPEPGDFNILTDWAGNPRCVVRVTRVTILPFREITWELCRREGEDDSLASWQAAHRKFFTAEGKALGYAFSEDMPVVFEEFTVVYPENQAD